MQTAVSSLNYLMLFELRYQKQHAGSAHRHLVILVHPSSTLQAWHHERNWFGFCVHTVHADEIYWPAVECTQT